MATEITNTEVSTENISTDKANIGSSYVPSSPTAPGTEGDIAWDSEFFYICIADNTWARTNINLAWG